MQFRQDSSWGRQSNALEGSIRIVPTTPELSRQLCHLLIKFNNGWSVVIIFNNEYCALNGNHKKGDNLFSKNLFGCLQSSFC